jgi:hypothetical protein
VWGWGDIRVAPGCESEPGMCMYLVGVLVGKGVWARGCGCGCGVECGVGCGGCVGVTHGWHLGDKGESAMYDVPVCGKGVLDVLVTP